MTPEWIYREFGYTLEDVACEIRKFGLGGGCEDTRRADLNGGRIEYYGNKKLNVYGLPHICFLELVDMFMPRAKHFRFTYEGRYFKHTMDIDSIFDFLKREHDSIPYGKTPIPEKHGWWEFTGNTYPCDTYKCSACGHIVTGDVAIYAEICPSCHVKMDMNKVHNK